MPPAVKKPQSKKEEKIISSEEFDGVTVESEALLTLLPLLESTEEHILLKTCSTLAEFSSYSELNRRFLLAASRNTILAKLFQLLQHESPAIHVETLRIMKTLLELDDGVKLAIALGDDLLKTLIVLLIPQEHSIEVIQMSLECLHHMSGRYMVKAAVVRLDGIQPLIHCLVLPSPDTQLHALHTITLVIEDYRALKSVRALEGFTTILQLAITSAYPTIQRSALQCLQIAVNDANIRQTLRDLNTPEQLVKLIGQPELCDLHIPAAAILANFLPDLETLKLMISDGSLNKLTEYITDVPRLVKINLPNIAKDAKRDTPSKQDKKKVAEKSAAKKPGKETAGKKGKAGDKPTEESKEVPQQLVVIEVYPEVKEFIAQAFTKGAKAADYRHCLNDIEIERVIVHLLSSPYATVRIAAACAVRVIAENIVSRDAFGHLGAIQKLVCMAASTVPDNSEEESDDKTVDRELIDKLRTTAISAILIITEMSDINCRELVDSYGVSTVLSLLRDENSPTSLLGDCMTILRNLSATLESFSYANSIDARKSAISSLCGILSNSQKSKVHSQAIYTLCQFLQEPCDKHLVLKYGGVKALIDILTAETASAETRTPATVAIAMLVDCPTIAEQFICIGGLEVLRRSIESEEFPPQWTKKAYKILLNKYLPAKFSIIGVLCESDLIGSGFYDKGRVTQGDEFIPQIIGGAAEASPSPSKNPTILACYQCTCPQCCCDSSILDTYECIPACLSSYIDQSLVTDICNMKEALSTIPCPVERIISLARYVCSKMGGSIEEDRLMNFDWQLFISQLRVQLNSDVIPIGAIIKGVHYHRALMFKIIGDSIGVRSKLVRGSDCYRAWVEVTVDISQPLAVPECDIISRCAEQSISSVCRCVVDLMHRPGSLLPCGSLQALRYTGTSSCSQ